MDLLPRSHAPDAGTAVKLRIAKRSAKSLSSVCKPPYTQFPASGGIESA